jgi:hypothetical protein
MISELSECGMQKSKEQKTDRMNSTFSSGINCRIAFLTNAQIILFVGLFES